MVHLEVHAWSFSTCPVPVSKPGHCSEKQTPQQPYIQASSAHPSWLHSTIPYNQLSQHPQLFPGKHMAGNGAGTHNTSAGVGARQGVPVLAILGAFCRDHAPFPRARACEPPGRDLEEGTHP